MESQGQPCLKGLPSFSLGATTSQDEHERNACENPDTLKKKRESSLGDLSLPQSKKHKEDGPICVSSKIEKNGNIPKVLLDDDDEENDDDVDDDKTCSAREQLGLQCCSRVSACLSESCLHRELPEDIITEVEPCNTSGKTSRVCAKGGHGFISVDHECISEMTNLSPGGGTSIVVEPHSRISDDNINQTSHRKEKGKKCVERDAEFYKGIKVAHATGCHGDVANDKSDINQHDTEESIHGKSSIDNSEGQANPIFTARPSVHQNISEEFQSHPTGEEDMNMEFHYSAISNKDIQSYHSGDEHQHEPAGQQDGKTRIPMKLDLEHLQLLNVGGTVEYIESLPSMVTVTSPHSNTGNHGDEGGAVNMPPGSEKISAAGQKVPHGTIIVSNSDQKPSELDVIPIQVYPQGQGISLVTSSGILTADISTFSTQVPAILTEGDADDSEAAASFAEQFHVVTSSNVLAGSSQIQGQTPAGEMLSVMMSSGDSSVVLTPEQQQAILGEVIAPAVAAGQTLHITIPQVTGHRIVTTTQGIEGAAQSPGISSVNQTKTIQVHLLSSTDTDTVKDGEGESDKTHSCPHPDCGKMCHRAHKLRLHMLSHTGERPYKCPHKGCEWSFTTAYKLKRHERGHTGERPFVCPHAECSRRFTTAYNLKTHIRAHNRTNTIVCQYEGCDKSFPTIHKYRVHERKHQQEDKPFKCEVDGCGKEFAAMGTLTSHLKLHTGERPHGCPVEDCGKRFTKASKLKLHLRTHTGERPFACNVEGCGWSFTSSYKLKRHMRKHTGERPFVCAYEGCHKSFTRSSHLKTHTLVHTGEKPYVCPIDGCNKAFTAGSSLNVHMRKHTGEKPFRCEEDGCTKAYTTASNLRAHQKRHDKTSKLLEGSEDQPLPSDYVTVSTINSASNASSLVDNDSYTGIHTFPSEDFTTDDVTSIPVSVHFPAGSLGAIVTNSGNPLTFSTAGSHEHSDIGEQGKGIQNDSAATVTLPVDHLSVDGSHIDVSEFVVRGDNVEPVLQHHDVSKHSDVDNLKHDGGFDLSITSIVSHLRSHESLSGGKLSTSDVLTVHGHGGERLVIDSKFVPSHSRSLEFRTPVNSEDQFKPPAVIFQEDSNKSGSSDTEGEVPQPHPDFPTTNQGLMHITLPQDVIQIHFPHQDDPPVPTENDVSMEMEATAGHQLRAFETSSLSDLQGHSLNKTDLSSPYMDESCSPEPDESQVDHYPESTINLQDLR